jgi:hypothetical protein
MNNVFLTTSKIFAATMAIALTTSCSSGNDAEREQLPQTQDNAVIDTLWSILSFQNRDGIVQIIPPEAEWGAHFYKNSVDMKDYMSVGFGPCSYLYFAYSLSDDTLTKLEDIIFPDHTCGAQAQILLFDLEIEVTKLFSESTAFLTHFGADGTLTLSTGNNESIVLTRDIEEL